MTETNTLKQINTSVRAGVCCTANMWKIYKLWLMTRNTSFDINVYVEHIQRMQKRAKYSGEFMDFRYIRAWCQRNIKENHEHWRHLYSFVYLYVHNKRNTYAAREAEWEWLQYRIYLLIFSRFINNCPLLQYECRCIHNWNFISLLSDNNNLSPQFIFKIHSVIVSHKQHFTTGIACH